MAPTTRSAGLSRNKKKKARQIGHDLAQGIERTSTQTMRKPQKQHHFATDEEKQRLFAAYDSGADFKTIAEHNGISVRQAYYLLARRRNPIKRGPWGGRRDSVCKVTQEMVDCCLREIEEKPTVTLKELKKLIFDNYEVGVCENTIRKHLICECYSLKQLRHRKLAMNLPDNIEKRKKFVLALEEYQKAGAMIVFFDETNFNLYTDCSQGRSRQGDRAVVQMLPPKEKTYTFS